MESETAALGSSWLPYHNQPARSPSPILTRFTHLETFERQQVLIRLSKESSAAVLRVCSARNRQSIKKPTEAFPFDTDETPSAIASN